MDFEPDERSNKALSGFMSNVNIQLRNRLAALLPSLDLLEKRLRETPGGGPDEAALGYLAGARRSAFSILRMANNMRDYANYTQNYAPGEPSHVDDLAGFVQAAAAEAQKLSGTKQVSIRFECGERPFAAYIDLPQTERLLYQLLSNAVLYGGNEITVGLKRAPGSVVLSVHNTAGAESGGAMPAIHEGYREFVQTGARGLGLGLSIALAIACQSGGTLITSSDGQGGTTVTASLPEAEDAPASATLEQPVFDGDGLAALTAFSDFPGNGPAYADPHRKDGEEQCITSMQ